MIYLLRQKGKNVIHTILKLNVSLVGIEPTLPSLNPVFRSVKGTHGVLPDYTIATLLYTIVYISIMIVETNIY